MFVYIVLPTFDPVMGAFLMLTVCSVPATMRVIEDIASLRSRPYNSYNEVGRQKGKLRRAGKWLMDLLGLVLQVGALVMFTDRIQERYDSIAVTIAFPLSTILISINWWPNFVRRFGALYRLRMKIKDGQARFLKKLSMMI